MFSTFWANQVTATISEGKYLAIYCNMKIFVVLSFHVIEIMLLFCNI